MYIYQFCVDTECHLEDLLRAMDGKRVSMESMLSLHFDDDDDDL